MTRRMLLMSGAALTVAGGGSAAMAAEKPGEDWTVFEAATGKELPWRDLAGRLSSAEGVFVGEQHDDPETHRVEAALLEAVYGKVGSRLTLAMEMFERDGQTALSDYVSGKINEAALGKAVRLWPNYATDYRPMIEFAKLRGIPVLASNAPQRIVRQVGKEGIAALTKLPEEDRALIARYVVAPEGDMYATRFTEVMSEGHGETKMDAAMIHRFYEAQCVRDDTMGETVAKALGEGKFVYHVNGSFHSDGGMGTVSRLLWRRPVGTQVRIVKVIPTNEPPHPEKLRGEADFLIYVPDRRPTKKGR